MALYTIFMTAVDVYVGIIIIYILMSWIPNMGGIVADVYEGLGRICDPYLDLFKRLSPPIGGSGMAVDFSPILAILVLQVAARFIGRLLLQFL